MREKRDQQLREGVLGHHASAAELRERLDFASAREVYREACDVLANEYAVDRAALTVATTLAVAAKHASATTAFAPPVRRDGRWTAARAWAVPRRAPLVKLANALAKVERLVEEAIDDPAQMEPWIRAAHEARRLPEYWPAADLPDREDQIHQLLRLLCLLGPPLHDAVPKGRKPRAAAGAGWQGAAAGLARHVWGRPAHGRNEWPDFAESWLGLLGVPSGEGRSQLTREDPPPSSQLEELLDAAGYERGTPVVPPTEAWELQN